MIAFGFGCMIATLGCSSEPPPPDGAPPSDTAEASDPPLCPTPIEVELSTWEFDPDFTNTFTPLAEGDELTIFQFASGGWYVQLAASVTGTGPMASITPDLRVVGCEDCLSAGYAVYIGLVGYDAETCVGTMWMQDTVLPVDPGMNMLEYMCSLEGEALELSLGVESLETGDTGGASVRVIARTDPESMGCAP